MEVLLRGQYLSAVKKKKWSININISINHNYFTEKIIFEEFNFTCPCLRDYSMSKILKYIFLLFILPIIPNIFTNILKVISSLGIMIHFYF